MIDRKSKKRRLYLCWLAAAVLAVVFVAPAFAQEDPNDPVLPDPNMPEEPRLHGTVEGTGTYFEVTDSNYLNITFESSEPVHLRLESVPEMVVMDINSADGAASTQITLTGFPPSTTYYKYEDDYHNGITFTTDLNGSYTFAQDLTQPHLVFIQPNPGTIFIPSDTSVGTWDPVTRTYTLTTDVYETIQIDEDNLTLDGAGHMVTGPGWWLGFGIYLPNRTGVTINNVNVQTFRYGIRLYNSSDNTLTANTASDNLYGITLSTSTQNTLTGNTATSNYSRGIYLDTSSHNTLTGNTANSNDWFGIFLAYSNDNTLTDNMASSNGCGIYLGYSNSNILTGNNTSNNEGQGIYLAQSNNNSLRGNTASNNPSAHGIRIYNYSSNNVLRDNTISNNHLGIWVEDSSNNILTGNTANSNYYWGIFVRRSDSTTLTGNTAESNGTGIYIGFSNDHTVTDNITSWNETYGIKLSRTNNSTLTGSTVSNNIGDGIELIMCSDNTLTGNTISNNGSGITLGASSNNVLTDNSSLNNGGDGIYLGGSSGNILTGNSISNNLRDGINIGQSSNNILTGNTISSNNRYGIQLYVSTNNQIYNNNFIENTTQAVVWGGSSGNIFNLEKPIGGNFWSDWTSPDDDGDGFVDYPYVFYGGQDNLPWARADGWAVTLVEIDIKPGSYPNAINLGSYGLVPVAILSSEDFDATTVDPDTVELAGAGVAVRGKSNKFMAHEEDVNGDDLVDLLLQVATQNLVPDSFQDGYAVLTGETYDGVSIEGEDEITIVPPEP